MCVCVVCVKVIVSSSITKDGLSRCKVDPCGDYYLGVKAYSVFCVFNVVCGSTGCPQCLDTLEFVHKVCAQVKIG